MFLRSFFTQTEAHKIIFCLFSVSSDFFYVYDSSAGLKTIRSKEVELRQKDLTELTEDFSALSVSKTCETCSAVVSKKRKNCFKCLNKERCFEFNGCVYNYSEKQQIQPIKIFFAQFIKSVNTSTVDSVMIQYVLKI